MSWHFLDYIFTITKFSLQRFRLDELENQGNYLVLGQVSPEDEGVSAVLILIQTVYLKSLNKRVETKVFPPSLPVFQLKLLSVEWLAGRLICSLQNKSNENAKMSERKFGNILTSIGWQSYWLNRDLEISNELWDLSIQRKVQCKCSVIIVW